ncbi:ATP-dependent zinc metalloprotease FtsH [Gallibacter intestinalis]|uniref:ATP-dependent zinc metalloprotease FtsH n=1 Tax=Gallibacter intestinalis TaxID=2779356 RepID=A0ABR9QV88_9FIRM|nr:ATP-dependent zinc metalloprotease FtsH [Gallibacter intestinalis]MBE5034787.1 ATP-dependent zinc metalloprotease FtsH [Gallibacter intestinalis]
MKKIFKGFGIYILILAIVLAMALFYDMTPKEQVKDISYSTLVDYIAKEEVKDIEFQEYEINATLDNGDKVHTYIHNSLDVERLHEQYLDAQSAEGKVKVSNAKPEEQPWIVSLIPTLIMIGVLIFFWVMIMRQQGGGGKAMSFGRSRAKMQTNLGKLTFKDVAGLDEEKEELQEIVDFLKNPRKYHNLGARIPKGVLLVGPPGTGKTYISKATAGEAGVPFFTISGSDFVEMFVGVGASRVRDLFEQAKKNAPCIIFIDEIDAVGRKRGAGMGGGHDEREQTLNQLLVEMDGFAEHMGIIILAATNRPDILDPALLRPGRFDRQIVIGVPDIKGREEIFRVHSKNKPLGEDVDPKVLARRTPGFTPADIENMLNEAALLTARRNGRKIRMEEIEEAITKVIAGPEKKSRVISEKEKRLTAIHEAGHAVVAHSIPDTDPVHQITIVPRGRAGGFTMILPREDRYYNTKKSMEDQIVHLLGGRVAEMLVLSDISTGASNDIQRATELARDMVTKYGFSEKLGPINYASSEEVFLGRDFGAKQAYSEETANEIDEEVKRIVHDGYEKAQAIINEHMDKLLAVTDALMELETIDGAQFEKLYSGEMTAEELIAETRAEDEKRAAENRQEAQETEEELKILERDLARYDEDYLNDDKDGDNADDESQDNASDSVEENGETETDDRGENENNIK